MACELLAESMVEDARSFCSSVCRVPSDKCSFPKQPLPIFDKSQVDLLNFSSGDLPKTLHAQHLLGRIISEIPRDHTKPLALARAKDILNSTMIELSINTIEPTEEEFICKIIFNFFPQLNKTPEPQLGL